MLMTEWDLDDYGTVRFEEGREEGRGEIIRKLFAEGSSKEFIQRITGLDTDTIKNIQTR